MLTQIISKIRSIVQDNSKSGSETFTAAGRTFVLTIFQNVTAITSITVNGTIIASNTYTFDSDDEVVTIDDAQVADGDVIIISFTYTKYSTTELNDYIRAVLTYLDINNYNPHFDVESGDEEIYPIPLPKEQNLIAMIAGILIKPEFSQYRTSTVSIVYPRTMDKDTKIEKLVIKFKRSYDGIVGIIDLAGDN